MSGRDKVVSRGGKAVTVIPVRMVRAADWKHNMMLRQRVKRCISRNFPLARSCFFCSFFEFAFLQDLNLCPRQSDLSVSTFVWWNGFRLTNFPRCLCKVNPPESVSDNITISRCLPSSLLWDMDANLNEYLSGCRWVKLISGYCFHALSFNVCVGRMWKHSGEG